MSLTAMLWLLTYLALVLLAFRRPAWGIALYMLTFYLSPTLWWWGDPLASIGGRINLATSLLLFAVVMLNSRGSTPLTSSDKTLFLFLLLYGVNAFFVHFLFASNEDRSLNGMTMIWKQIGLLYLLVRAIRSREDIDLFIGAILTGSLYIGYEVVINERGGIAAGRLEGVGAPGASEANYLAGLMCFALPLAGYWLFFGGWLRKLYALTCAVFIFELVLRCNSRGAFLSLLLAGGWLLVIARGRERKYAFGGICLAALAALLMIGDATIIERFTTTFASAEQRDESADSRLQYWSCALQMISENPAGSGAEAAFKSDVGLKYLKTMGIDVFRAVHNGYLDIAASWGVQGFVLYLGVIFYVWRRSVRNRKTLSSMGDSEQAFLGVCLESTLVTQVVVCLFISSLDGEWFFWWFALVVGIERVMEIQRTSAGNRAAGHTNALDAKHRSLSDPAAPSLSAAHHS